MKKKILACVLALCMICNTVEIPVSAETDETIVAVESVTETDEAITAESEETETNETITAESEETETEEETEETTQEKTLEELTETEEFLTEISTEILTEEADIEAAEAKMTSIVLSKSCIKINGATKPSSLWEETLTITNLPQGEAPEFVWSSSDTTVATVTQDGISEDTTVMIKMKVIK